MLGYLNYLLAEAGPGAFVHHRKSYRTHNMIPLGYHPAFEEWDGTLLRVAETKLGLTYRLDIHRTLTRIAVCAFSLLRMFLLGWICSRFAGYLESGVQQVERHENCTRPARYGYRWQIHVSQTRNGEWTSMWCSTCCFLTRHCTPTECEECLAIICAAIHGLTSGVRTTQDQEVDAMPSHALESRRGRYPLYFMEMLELISQYTTQDRRGNVQTKICFCIENKIH